MATRSFIGIYDGKEQSAEYIYCHNDGYLEWVGADLINYYNDERTIRALLKKGNLSSLHPEIDTCTFSQEYEPSMKIDDVKTIHEAFYQMHEESIEYMYLYDKDSRKWYYVKGVPSKRTKGKVLPDMESSENFDSLKDAIAYINGVLDRNGGSVDITKKHIYMQDEEWGRYYDITTIEKDGRDVVISTEQGKTFKLSALKKPVQWRILNNLKSYKVERRGFRFQKRESVFQKESVKTDYTGGFTDTMKAVDAELTAYYKGGQVEILVTDNGTATVVIYPKSGDTEAVQIQLDYSKDKAKVTDDDNNSITVDVDVDAPEFDKLADGIITLVDKQLAKTKKKEALRRASRFRRKNESYGVDYEDLMPALVEAFNRNKRRFNVNPRYVCTYKMVTDHLGILTIRNYLKFKVDIWDSVEVPYADTNQSMGVYDTADFDNVSDLAESIIIDIIHTM